MQAQFLMLEALGQVGKEPNSTLPTNALLGPRGGQRGSIANYEAARAVVHSEPGLDATAHHPSPDPTCTDCMCLFAQSNQQNQVLLLPPLSVFSSLQPLGTQVVLPFHQLCVQSWLCDLTFVDASAWNIPLPDLPPAGSSSKP